MATIIEAVEVTSTRRVPRRIGILRLALTGAIVAPVFFVLCWLGTFLPFGSPTHAYLALFTNAEMMSAAALLQGVFWSAAFGLLVGGLTAIVYNLLAPLD
jgi:hypothetical protein